MVAVAGGAGWRAEVATDGQRVMMHAVAVLCELIRRDGVSLHIRGVGMAARTRLRNVQRMNFRARVARWPQIVHAMAIDAHRYLAIAFGKKLAMHTGLVLT